jgi:hypothetical protein
MVTIQYQLMVLGFWLRWIFDAEAAAQRGSMDPIQIPVAYRLGTIVGPECRRNESDGMNHNDVSHE